MLLFLLAIGFCPLLFVTNGNLSQLRYNSLLSAQCKARCLSEYRNHSQYHRTFLSIPSKRYLSNHLLTLSWRSIWERCPRLLTCSSCLIPCDLDPPLLLSNQQTCQAICSSLKVSDCEQSCLFIRNLYEQQSKCSTTRKHCSEPIAQPTYVHAIERKSGRTVRLKWTSDTRLNLQPVFYVIEAQWTRPKTDSNQYELVSKWGFVKEEVSNSKAIIRNIQRDDRWYQFRVAAVTKDGFSTYSIPTRPFRLTNQSSEFSPSVIDSPRNFSVKAYQLNSNTLNLTLTWQKADSTLITGYQISWESKDPSSSFANTIDTSALELTIPFLSTDQTYLFKIRAISRSTGNHIQMSSPQSIDFDYQKELFSLKNVRVSPPYFHNGLIKANLSWNAIGHSRFNQFDIYWIETQCSSNVFSCCYRRDAVTIQNFFQLYDLRFNCTYLIQIQIKSGEVFKPFQIYFNVSSCQSIDVVGPIQPPCQTDRKTVDIFSSLPTFDLIAVNNQSGLNLFWKNLPSYDENMFYQLRIDRIPSHSNLLLVDLPLTITTYFLPYSNRETQKYFNITLRLFANQILRQEQSILIYDKQEHSHFTQFFNQSARTSLSVALIFVTIIRWIIF